MKTCGNVGTQMKIAILQNENCCIKSYICNKSDKKSYKTIHPPFWRRSGIFHWFRVFFVQTVSQGDVIALLFIAELQSEVYNNRVTDQHSNELNDTADKFKCLTKYFIFWLCRLYKL